MNLVKKIFLSFLFILIFAYPNTKATFIATGDFEADVANGVCEIRNAVKDYHGSVRNLNRGYRSLGNGSEDDNSSHDDSYHSVTVYSTPVEPSKYVKNFRNTINSR
ncbi:MAG: hypothetical protein GY765_10595, partial [bacterium]|nr:hypothetical protein [bacterium]